MVLLKILFWLETVNVGLVFLAVFLLSVFILYKLLRRSYILRRINKEMRRYMLSHRDFAKLLNYAESQGIRVIVDPLSPFSWAAVETQKLILFRNPDDVYNPSRQKDRLRSFAHEIAHIEYYARRKGKTCFVELSERFPDRRFGCFWDEIWAWVRAEVILDSLGIKVNKIEYWLTAIISIPQHIPCPLWIVGKCPKFKAIKKMQTRLMAKLETLCSQLLVIPENK